MSDPSAAAQLRADVNSLIAHNARREEILSGDRFPDLDELRAGQPFFKGNMRLDIRTALQSELLRDDLEQPLRDALQLAFDNPTRDTVRAAAALIDYPSTLQRRLDLYAAHLGDDGARDRTIRRAFEDIGNSRFSDAVMTLSLGSALAFQSGRNSDPDSVTVERVDAHVARGTDLLERLAGLSARLVPALAMLDADEDALTQYLDGDDEPAAAKPKGKDIQIEDGIPEAYLGGPAPKPEPEAPGAVVVPLLDAKKATSHNRDIIKTWAGIAGERLPIAQVKDLAASAGRLAARWPWATEVIHAMLSDLSAGGDVVFAPTCLVGLPGCGKTALLRGMAEELGLHSQAYDLGGQADSSLMGTSSRFSTAEESSVLLFIKQVKMASVAFIWDEIEKAAEGRQNGSAQDAMLPYLVRHQAARLRDPCLNVEVDLSYVSHFATANTMAGVPAPLRDRMRVIRMPSPGPQHIGVLVEHILDDLATRRKLDRAWLPPLAEDELDTIRDAWSGGSIRRLERYVEITVAKRDEHMIGRA